MFSPQFKVALVAEVFSSEGAYTSLHDAVFEALDECPTEEEAHLIFFNLPETIQCDALKWGLTDTEVSGDICEHLLNQKTNGKDNE